MFSNFRNSWRLKARINDVEETLATVLVRQQRHVNKVAEDLDLLRLEVQRLRGRVTGQIRNPDVEPEDDWRKVDDDIRQGRRG